ncbi:FecR family protein [Hymenobacter sp. HD11105]
MQAIDFDACMRYVRGESSLEEAQAVRAWLQDPANELLARHWMSRQADALEASPQAGDSPSPINLEGVRAQLHQRLGVKDEPRANRRPATFRWGRWAAAAAVGGLAAGGTLWSLSPGGPDELRPVVVYTTPYGQTRQVRLPDGSTVTLNANSTLRHAAVWRANTPREVWLDGEAYFSVKHLPTHQRFRVHTTGSFHVEVLGTQFTVYRRHEQARVVLLSGKVRVDFADQHQADVTLQPGELLQTADAQPAQVVRKAVAAPAYAAWKDQKLVLDDTPIGELSTMLHDTYGLNVIILDPALRRQTITGTVPVGDIDLLCQAIEATFHLQVQHRGNQIIISSF